MISEQFYIFPCYLFQLRETRWISFLVQLQRQQNHLSQITEVHDTKDLGKAGGEVKLIIHLLQCVCRVYNRLMWWWSDSWPCMGRCSIFIESTLFHRIPRINPFFVYCWPEDCHSLPSGIVSLHYFSPIFLKSSFIKSCRGAKSIVAIKKITEKDTGRHIDLFLGFLKA